MSATDDKRPPAEVVDDLLGDDLRDMRALAFKRDSELRAEEAARQAADEERWTMRRVLDRAPKPLLVALVLAMAGALLGAAQVIASQWNKTDERQDAAIAAQEAWKSDMKESFGVWQSKVNYFIVIAERADRKLDDMREETLREYRAQAADRGDRAGVRRLDSKLAVIDQAKAAGQPVGAILTPPTANAAPK